MVDMVVISDKELVVYFKIHIKRVIDQRQGLTRKHLTSNLDQCFAIKRFSFHAKHRDSGLVMRA